MTTSFPPARAPFAPPLLLVADAEREKVGDLLGQYELLALVGEGTMGRVFKARHVHLGRVVAVKVLRTEYACNREVLQRFFQEAQAVNQINHPHIVEVLDFIEEQGPGGLPRLYCVMELLEGVSLAERLSLAPLRVREVAALALQVCAALAAAHQVGVVHRDVKPENLLLRRTEEGATQVKVLDFGVAKLLAPLAGIDATHTAQGTVLGTPSYMAPEQARGAATDGRADIYSLGVVLYEMLSGRLPFEGDSLPELWVQLERTPPRALGLSTLGGEPLPSALRDLVLRCLEKDPARRFPSMQALAAALRPFLAAQVPTPRRPRWPLRVGVGAAVASLALVGALAASRSEEGPATTVSRQSPRASAPIAPAAPRIAALAESEQGTRSFAEASREVGAARGGQRVGDRPRFVVRHAEHALSDPAPTALAAVRPRPTRHEPQPLVKSAPRHRRPLVERRAPALSRNLPEGVIDPFED